MRTGVVKDKSRDKNVVHCRLKKAGKRFELSLLRDKIPSKEELKGKQPADVNWDLLLAQRAVFANAAKAELAKQSDLDAAFEGLSEAEIFLQILTKGEMLLTQEERAEQSHDASDHLRAVAERVAAMIFARPSAEEVQQLASKKGGKHRLRRYSVDDVERELKNVKFRPTSTELADQAVEGVVAVSCGVMLPTLREQSLLSIKPPQHVLDCMPLKDFGASLATFKPGYCKVVDLAKGSVLVTIDPTVKAALEAFAPGSEITVVEAQHVPKGAADDLTGELPAPSGPPKASAKKAPPKKEEKPKEKEASKPAQSDSDDDKPHRKHHGVSKLEAELAALKADDDEDSGKGKKGTKSSGKEKKAPPAKAAPPPAPKPAVQLAKGKAKAESASDESEPEEVQTMKPKKRR